MNPTSNQTNVQLRLLNDNLSRKIKKQQKIKQRAGKQIKDDTMNPTDNSTKYLLDNKITKMSPTNGNSISSDILVFPHTEAIKYPPPKTNTTP